MILLIFSCDKYLDTLFRVTSDRHVTNDFWPFCRKKGQIGECRDL